MGNEIQRPTEDNENSTEQNQTLEKIKECCNANSSLDEFKIALNVNEDQILSIENQRILSSTFDRGYNSILLLAIKNNNKEIPKYLASKCDYLTQQLDFYHQKEVSTTAFEKNELDLLKDLIEFCDFPFPEDFDENLLADGILKELCNKRNAFYDCIDKKSDNEIDEFISENSQTKYVFDTNNETLLFKAWKKRNFRLFYFLKSRGFRSVEAERCECFEDLSYEEKIKADQVSALQINKNVKYSREYNNKTILFLMGKTSIHDLKLNKENVKDFCKKIKQWYIDILNIKYGEKLLNVITQCDQLKIIFDFQSETEQNINVRKDNEGYGGTYTKHKWIFIGAKNLSKSIDRENEIKGVIAHEMCHYALALVYNNNEQPYYKNDNKGAKKFKKIVEMIKKDLENNNFIDKCDGNIASVYKNYHPLDWDAELIVRVVQILTQYKDDKNHCKKLEKLYKCLFNFFNNDVLPELEHFNLKIRDKIRFINMKSKLFLLADEKSYDLKSPKIIKESDFSRFNVIETNNTCLFLVNIFHYIDIRELPKPEILYITSEIFETSSEDYKEIVNNTEFLRVIIDCSGGFENLPEFMFNKNVITYIFITTHNEQRDQLNTFLNSSSHSEVKNFTFDYEFNSLSDESKSKCFNQEIIFQGEKITIKSLLSENLNNFDANMVVDNNSLNQLTSFKSSNLEISINCTENEIIEEDFKSFIKRNFFKCIRNFEDKTMSLEQYKEKEMKPLCSNLFGIFSKIHNDKMKFTYNDEQYKSKYQKNIGPLSQDELLSNVEGRKIVSIIGIPGSGKTWALQNIKIGMAKKYKNRWISYIEIDKDKLDRLKNSEFTIENIIEFQNSFERNIFKFLYKYGKVIILLDNFDKVPLEMNQQFIKSFNLKQNNGNQLWIASSIDFLEDFQDDSDFDEIYTLQAFSKEEVITLILKNCNDFNLMSVKTLFQNFSIINNEWNEILMFIKIISQWTIPNVEDKAVNAITMNHLYETFIEQQCMKWSTCGNLSQLIKTHQYIAMLRIFPNTKSFLGFEYSKEKILKDPFVLYGFVARNGEKYLFPHKNFADYFVARYFTELLKCNTKTDKEFWSQLISIFKSKSDTTNSFLNDALEDHFDSINTTLSRCKNEFNTKDINDISNYFFEKKFVKLAMLFLMSFEDRINNSIFECSKLYLTTKSEVLANAFKNCFVKMNDKDLMKKVNGGQIFHEIIYKNYDAHFINIIISESKAINVKNMLNCRDNNTGRNLLHTTIGKRHKESYNLNVIINIFEEHFSYLEITEILEDRDKFGQNSLYSTKYLKLPTTKNLCQDKTISSILINNQNNFDKIWDMIIKNFKKSQQITKLESLFNKIEKKGKTFIQCWISEKRADLVKLLLEKLKNDDCFQKLYHEILFSKDINGLNLLQIAAYESNDLETFQIIWNLLNTELNDEDFEKFLGPFGNKNRNILQLAICASTVEIFDFIIEKIEEKKDQAKNNRNKIKNMMLHKDLDNHNILYIAVQENRNECSHKKLWTTLSDYFKPEKIRDLIECSEGNETLLNYGFIYNEEKVIRLTCDNIFLYINDDVEIKEYLKRFYNCWNADGSKYEEICKDILNDRNIRINRNFTQRARKTFWNFRNYAYNTTTIIIIILILSYIYGIRFKNTGSPYSRCNSTQQNMIKESEIIYKQVNVKFGSLFENNSLAYDQLTEENIKDMLSKKRLNFDHHSFYDFEKYIVFDWKTLDNNFKEKIKKSNFIYQNETMNLSKFYEMFKEIFDTLTSKEISSLLNGVLLTIGNQIYNTTPSNDSNTNFQSSNSFFPSSEILPHNHLKLSNIELDSATPETFEKCRFFIVKQDFVDGNFKSFEMSSIKKLKKKFLNHWIAYIDLNSSFAFLNDINSVSDEENMLISLLGLNLKSEFEKNFFKASYKTGKVIFLWDGLNEISQNYTRYISNLIFSNIYPHTENIQLVSMKLSYAQLLSEDQTKIQNAKFLYKNVKVLFKELFSNRTKIYEELIPKHISQMLNNIEIDIDTNEYIYLIKHIYLEWSKMNVNLRNIVLKSSFDFQGKTQKFESISNINETLFSFLTSKQIFDILNGSPFKVGKEISETDPVHITNKKIYFLESSKLTKDDYIPQGRQALDKIINNYSYKSKIIIKTQEYVDKKLVSFSRNDFDNIKKKFPDRWVAYIDVRNHLTYFSKENEMRPKEILENIQGLSSENKFEREIFLSSFDSDNVIFLWTGFDEISTSYFEKISSLIFYIHQKTKNIHIISSQTPFKFLSNDDQHNIKMSKVLYKTISVQFSNLFAEDSEAYDLLNPVDIVDILRNKLIDMSLKKYKDLESLVNLNWNTLKKTLKDRILVSNLSFQNQIQTYQQFHDFQKKSFDLLTSDQIISILNREVLKFGEFVEALISLKIISSSNQFAKVTLKKFNLSKIDYKTVTNYNLDQILEKNQNLRIFILQQKLLNKEILSYDLDSIKNLKKIYKYHWIAYIDLRERVWFLEDKTISKDPEKFFKKVLQFKSNFDEFLFFSSLKNDKVIILWDGLDEISPTLSDSAISLISNIFRNTLNIQIISARLLYNDLQDAEQNKIRNKQVLYKNEKVLLNDLLQDKSEAYQEITGIDLLKFMNPDPVDFSNSEFSYINKFVYHNWATLNENLRRKVMEFSVEFQGMDIKISKVHKVYKNAFNSLSSNQITNILDNHIFEVGKINFKVTNVEIKNEKIMFLARFLEFSKLSKGDFISLGRQALEKIINSHSNKPKIIIKTQEYVDKKLVSFSKKDFVNIKKKFPDRWVAYIDVRNYLTYFSKENKMRPKEILENIQGLNSENEFEREIFLSSFDSDNVIFLWTGFDEISTSYFEKISSLIFYIHQQTKNIQLICTQTSFEFLSSDEQHNIKMSTVLYKGIRIRFSDLFIENQDVYKDLKPSDISDILNNEEINISSSNYKYLDELIILKWKSLDQNLKRKVLGSEFNYQGTNFPMKEIDVSYPNILPLLESTQIVLVLNNESLKVGNNLNALANEGSKPKQNIDIKGEVVSCKKSVLCKLQNIEKVDNQNQIKYGLINNELFNKSIAENSERSYKLFVLTLLTAEEKRFGFDKKAIKSLKTQSPMTWVSYINLKQFSEYQIGNFFNGNTFSNPIKILQKILYLSEKNSLENGLFEASYNSGKVVLFWDGFENVSENNMDQLFELIKVINKNSGNFQFVSSVKGAATGKKDSILSIYTTLIISALLLFSKNLMLA